MNRIDASHYYTIIPRQATLVVESFHRVIIHLALAYDYRKLDTIKIAFPKAENTLYSAFNGGGSNALTIS